ncbi:antitoxin VapB family protein [Halovivax sp.]|uniref:antitoxin VapB family protein n=1 Tax=Halovivax sp. TaxID=1935978 RepID=UPI0025BD0FF2|nr:antitoxin VapB family protein [Halovivax sp.]
MRGSKNIAISDDVYEHLKREKGDRSFGEEIEDRLESGDRIDDVVGTGALDLETQDEVSSETERMSRGPLSRMDDGTLWYVSSRRRRSGHEGGDAARRKTR